MRTIKYFLTNAVLTVCFSLCIISCSGPGKTDYEVQTELELVDSLGSKLGEITGWLNRVPAQEISGRIQAIEDNLQFISEYASAEDTAANARLIGEYKAFRSNYLKLLKEYKPIVTETEELYYHLKTLKQSASDKDYPKEEFKTYLAREKQSVDILYMKASVVLKSFMETDLHFERRQDEIEALCEELKAGPKYKSGK